MIDVLERLARPGGDTGAMFSADLGEARCFWQSDDDVFVAREGLVQVDDIRELEDWKCVVVKITVRASEIGRSGARLVKVHSSAG